MVRQLSFLWLAFWIWLVLIFNLACTRSYDPLETTVAAATPRELQNWLNDEAFSLPADLYADLNRAIDFLSRRTPRRLPVLDSTTDALCLRLDGRTVRQIIVLAFQEELELLQNSLRREQTSVLQLVAAGGALDNPAELTRSEAAIAARRELITSLQTQIAHTEKNLRRFVNQDRSKQP